MRLCVPTTGPLEGGTGLEGPPIDTRRSDVSPPGSAGVARPSGRGITGVHERVFRETPEGVHVTTDWESFAGEPVVAELTGMQSALDSPLAAWPGHLKAAVESALTPVTQSSTAGGR